MHFVNLYINIAIFSILQLYLILYNVSILESSDVCLYIVDFKLYILLSFLRCLFLACVTLLTLHLCTDAGFVHALNLHQFVCLAVNRISPVHLACG